METVINERPIPTGEGLTFEKVWAMFQESERKSQEYERRSQLEYQEIRNLQKETAESQKETDRRFKETERLVKETSKQMGLLHNSFGELAEHLVAPGIVEKFNDLGFGFNRWSNNVKLKESGKKIVEAEIDILLENGEVAIAVEVKAKTNDDDIEDFLEKMKKVRSYANRIGDKRKYLGAIAGAIMSESIKRKIIKTGIYVIEQTGDTMKINIPEGFVPREW